MRLIDADKLDYELKIALKNYEHPVAMVASMTVANAPTVDQWHYPSKGEYPKKNVEVLCRLWFGGYIVAHLREDDEFCAGRVAFNIECWQYIVPPKEIE